MAKCQGGWGRRLRRPQWLYIWGRTEDGSTPATLSPAFFRGRTKRETSNGRFETKARGSRRNPIRIRRVPAEFQIRERFACGWLTGGPAGGLALGVGERQDGRRVAGGVFREGAHSDRSHLDEQLGSELEVGHQARVLVLLEAAA
jgi:hypothetical protein